jgi:hypothetical protein
MNAGGKAKFSQNAAALRLVPPPTHPSTMRCWRGAEAIEAATIASMPNYVGKQWRISGLTSARGMEINGLLGTCEGFDHFPDLRLHLRVAGFDTVFKVRFANISDPQVRPPSEPNSVANLDMRGSGDMDRATILRVARTQFDGRTAHDHIRGHATVTRLDMRHRASRLLECLNSLEQGTSLEPPRLGCGETTEEALRDPFVRNMMQIKPPCVGNGRFCLHELHDSRVGDQQAAKRLAEYPMSGFCIKCQILYLEGDA